MTIEEEIESLKARADRHQWVVLQFTARECRQVAEWLEELVELRKRLEVAE